MFASAATILEKTWGAMRGWRGALDIVATIVMIAAGLKMIGGVGAFTHRATQHSIKLPRIPVDLDGVSKGSIEAPVVMIEYSEFQCPFCGRFAREVLPAIEKEYVDSGKLRIVFRHFPLPVHPFAEGAAQGAACAAQQGHFWEMHDLLFASQAQLDRASVEARADKIGLDHDVFEACLGSPRAAELVRDAATAATFDVTGTPTFLIGRLEPAGQASLVSWVQGAQPIDEFRKAFDAAVAKRVP
jgi:protein-disulfide isomerase